MLWDACPAQDVLSYPLVPSTLLQPGGTGVLAGLNQGLADTLAPVNNRAHVDVSIIVNPGLLSVCTPKFGEGV